MLLTTARRHRANLSLYAARGTLVRSMIAMEVGHGDDIAPWLLEDKCFIHKIDYPLNKTITRNPRSPRSDCMYRANERKG
jgi:hypothetical protein